LRFAATSGTAQIALDSDGSAGLTPPEALAMALAGCMAIDVVDIVTKGRHRLSGLEASLVGQRLDDPPRRFIAFSLHFSMKGDVPAGVVERAIRLSREKYCSVWHSLRPDIELDTSFEVQA
jgi:putative redox protein